MLAAVVAKVLWWDAGGAGVAMRGRSKAVVVVLVLVVAGDRYRRDDGRSVLDGWARRRFNITLHLDIALVDC